MDGLITTLLAGGINKFFAWVASVGGFAVAVPLALEALKRWRRVPWIDEYTDTINRVVAVLASVVAANGISYAYDGATGDLVLQGLTAAALAKVVMAMATQFGLQELVYRQVVKRIPR